MGQHGQVWLSGIEVDQIDAPSEERHSNEPRECLHARRKFQAERMIKSQT
jgi:hypothetical protein